MNCVQIARHPRFHVHQSCCFCLGDCVDRLRHGCSRKRKSRAPWPPPSMDGLLTIRYYGTGQSGSSGSWPSLVPGHPYVGPSPWEIQPLLFRIRSIPYVRDGGRGAVEPTDYHLSSTNSIGGLNAPLSAIQSSSTPCRPANVTVRSVSLAASTQVDHSATVHFSRSFLPPFLALRSLLPPLDQVSQNPSRTERSASGQIHFCAIQERILRAVDLR